MSNQNDQMVQFKELMGNYPTGVTVVTAVNESGRPIGLTVNSFTSISIDPLLIMWSIDKKVSTYDSFMKIDRFAVNILAADQTDLVKLFTKKDIDRFQHCEWAESDLGLPILANTIGSLQCKVYNRFEAGDHTILLGEVAEVQSKAKDPLLYHKRKVGPIPAEFYN